MKLGELNLPEIELERFVFIHDYQTKLFVQYAEIIEKTEIGSRIIEILSRDPRVQGLAGKMIFSGGSIQGFEIKTLGMWLLWFANKVGLSDAEKALNNFLDKQVVEVLNCLWILGVKTDQDVSLFKDIRLIPVEKMIDSRDKEKFWQHNPDIHNHSPFQSLL
jgi:hypothetical protein